MKIEKEEEESEILNLFTSAVPLYSVVRVEEQPESEIKGIDEILKNEMIKNVVGDSISTDKYILNRPELKTLNAFIKEHIDKYVENVMCPKNESLEFYITQSWLNLTKTNEGQELHDHPNSFISGVYYFTDECFLNLCNPNYYLERNTIWIQPKRDNLWNSFYHNVKIKSKQNTLILFPSWIKHEVPENQSSSDRMSMAFNVFVKGDLEDCGIELNELKPR